MATKKKAAAPAKKEANKVTVKLKNVTGKTPVELLTREYTDTYEAGEQMGQELGKVLLPIVTKGKDVKLFISFDYNGELLAYANVALRLTHPEAKKIIATLKKGGK